MKSSDSLLPSGMARTRRHFGIALKRQIVNETLAGESVSRVARRHDINANQLFRWRRLHQQGKLGAPSTTLLPVTVTAPVELAVDTQQFIIEFGQRCRLIVNGNVNAALLLAALKELKS
jgi:transposase